MDRRREFVESAVQVGGRLWPGTSVEDLGVSSLASVSSDAGLVLDTWASSLVSTGFESSKPSGRMSPALIKVTAWWRNRDPDHIFLRPSVCRAVCLMVN